MACHGRVVLISVFLVILKPILIYRSHLPLRRLPLHFHRLRLVRLQIVRNVPFFGRLGRLGRGECHDMAIGVGRFDGGGLVGFELAQVEVLYQVGCAEGVSRSERK